MEIRVGDRFVWRPNGRVWVVTRVDDWLCHVRREDDGKINDCYGVMGLSSDDWKRLPRAEEDRSHLVGTAVKDPALLREGDTVSCLWLGARTRPFRIEANGRPLWAAGIERDWCFSVIHDGVRLMNIGPASASGPRPKRQRARPAPPRRRRNPVLAGLYRYTR